MRIRPFSLLVSLAFLAASPASAQTIVVVPWTVGEGDTSAMRSTADAVSLAIPVSAGSVFSIGETASRFETRGSSSPPTVSSAELDQWAQLSRAAVRALANEDYAAARESLRQAQAISDRAASEMSREEARARQVLDTCLFGVRAYIEQQDPHAEEQMLGCRRLVPRISPSASIHTPEVVEVLGRIDRRLAAAHRGPLVVESQPSGCTVRLNGVALGQTPFTSEQLAPGEYRVQVECGEGDHARVHRVTVPDEAGPRTLHIDARFDRAIRTDGLVRLVYSDVADAGAHRAIDAREIGRAIGAAEVWLVTRGADGSLSGERVRVLDGAVTSGSAADGSSTVLVNALATAAPASPPEEGPVASVGGGGGGSVQPGSWAVLVGGGVVAIVGAVLLGVGVPDLDAIAAPRPGESFNGSVDRQHTGETLTYAGIGVLSAGVIALGVGIGLAISDTSQRSGAQARLRIGPTGLSLRIDF